MQCVICFTHSELLHQRWQCTVQYVWEEPVLAYLCTYMVHLDLHNTVRPLIKSHILSALSLSYTNVYIFLLRRPMLKCRRLETLNVIRFRDLEMWLACLVSVARGSLIIYVQDILWNSSWPAETEYPHHCTWPQYTSGNTCPSVLSAFHVLPLAYECETVGFMAIRKFQFFLPEYHFCLRNCLNTNIFCVLECEAVYLVDLKTLRSNLLIPIAKQNL
jgi:hypothetical protein